MKNNNRQRKVNYLRIFYFGLESNPLKKNKIPSGVATVRTRVFHNASVLVGGNLMDVESNQSRKFVLLNKQKFV